MNMETRLLLHEVHESLGATFDALGGMECVSHYGEPEREYSALQDSVGLLDLGFRGRFCLTGADRIRLLHGQVTNDIQGLAVWEGCYAAFVSHKGRMQADAFIYALAEEILVDVEPGLTQGLLARMEHHIVADDVQCVDVSPYYGLLSVQGPRSAAVLDRLELKVPSRLLGVGHLADPGIGDLYVMRNPRTGGDGFDLFIPVDAQAMVLDKALAAAKGEGGRMVGWHALELSRIEAGIPRFGADMDETNLPPETGIEGRAVSYSKGCYIGQEVIARIRTYGQVAKKLRGLRFSGGDGAMPVRGDKLVRDGREVGTITSVARSPKLGGAVIGLGYVRRECNAMGTVLEVRAGVGGMTAGIVPLPFAVGG
jgi:folate-binding protein YgfZ